MILNPAWECQGKLTCRKIALRRNVEIRPKGRRERGQLSRFIERIKGKRILL